MTDLKSLSPDDLVLFLVELGEPAYRGRQTLRWIYGKGVSTFSEMTNLPSTLRTRLEGCATIAQSSLHEQQLAADQTIKLRFRLASGRFVESVLIPDFDDDGLAKRITACVSSQVGCAMGCAFCATGLLGFQQNLTPGEIFDQVRFLNGLAIQRFSRRVTNIVFMGMGEPLLNYDAVLSSIAFMTHPDGLAMAARRITVSTVGLARRIHQLADDNTGFGLALSLHAPTDAQRSAIMPANRSSQTDLLALKNALLYYSRQTNQSITYEYCLFKGVNDGLEDARLLADVSRWVPSKVNLISYNPVEGLPFQRSGEETLNMFASILAEAGVRVTVRKSRGQDIAAACGQLAGKIG